LLLQDRLLQPATIHFLFPEFLHGIIHGKLLAHLHRIYVWMYAEEGVCDALVHRLYFANWQLRNTCPTVGMVIVIIPY
jgi:hypothetical protein